MLIGQGDFGQFWAFWVEKRGLSSVEKKSLVKRDLFLYYNGCRIVRPNDHFFICSMLMFSGCRIVRPNGHFFYLFNVDVQWLSGSQAEWSSFLYCSMPDVQWVSGSYRREAWCSVLWCRVSLLYCCFVSNLSYINMCIFCIIFIYLD